MSYTEPSGPELGFLDIDAVEFLYGLDSQDGSQAASWSWDSLNAILTQTGFSGADIIRGGATTDIIDGLAGDDTLFGGFGNDLIFGGDGADRLIGGDGGDVLEGGSGNDKLEGGLGRDTASYESATSGVTVSLTLTAAQNTIGAGSDELTEIKRLTGSAHNDTLTGDSGVNLIDGGAGNDNVTGGSGGDFLAGGPGTDLLSGGVGQDTIFGDDGDDIVYGDSGDDYLYGDDPNPNPALTMGSGTANPTITIAVPNALDPGVTAVRLDTGFSLASNANIINSTLFPHMSASATSTGDYIYYAFQAYAGMTGYFDIDVSSGFDPYIYLFDADGNLLAEDDDSVPTAGAGGSTGSTARIDSYLVYVFGSTGLYFLRAADWIAVEIPAGAKFDLQFSLNTTIDPDYVRPAAAAPGYDQLFGGIGNDWLYGGSGNDTLDGGSGNDTLNGGLHVDSAVLSGNRSDYVITPGASSAMISGPDGTDTLERVERLVFDDMTLNLPFSLGVSVDVANADPDSFMVAIRDFDGNDLGSFNSWFRIGSTDIQRDGDTEYIFVNRDNGRWATVGPAYDGLIYFNDHSWGGDTRVVGIYIDPLVESGDVEQGGPFDSQQRFQNDLNIENINAVLHADDYDGDGLQEIYFGLTDETAYLHAYMHADGNIRYANYQSEA